VPLDAELLDQARTAKAKVDVADAQPDSDIARTEFIQAVRRLHLAGGSPREIARALGLPHQLVHNIAETASGSRSQRKGPAGPGELLSCSFCGKNQKQIIKLIAGQSKHICNECIDRAHTVLGVVGNVASTPIATIRQLSDDADRAKRCSFCGKQRRHVVAMASTAHARICNECIELCDEIISEELDYSVGQDHLGAGRHGSGTRRGRQVGRRNWTPS